MEEALDSDSCSIDDIEDFLSSDDWSEYDFVQPRNKGKKGRNKRGRKYTGVKKENRPPWFQENQFAPLAAQVKRPKGEINNSQLLTSHPTPTYQPVPPIRMKNVDDYRALTRTIKATLDDNFTLRYQGETLVIQTSSTSDYKKLADALREAGFQFVYHKLPEDEPFWVIIRNIAPVTPTELIKKGLESLGFTVLNIRNAVNPQTKKGIPTFFVGLKNDNYCHNILSLDRLLNYNIKVEICKEYEVEQCKNCQNFFHSQNNCKKSPRCIRCGLKHTSKYCTVIDQADLKCALCGGNHPANYKGCPSYREALKRGFKEDSVTSQTKPLEPEDFPNIPTSITVPQTEAPRNNENEPSGDAAFLNLTNDEHEKSFKTAPPSRQLIEHPLKAEQYLDLQNRSHNTYLPSSTATSVSENLPSEMRRVPEPAVRKQGTAVSIFSVFSVPPFGSDHFPGSPDSQHYATSLNPANPTTDKLPPGSVELPKTTASECKITSTHEKTPSTSLPNVALGPTNYWQRSQNLNSEESKGTHHSSEKTNYQESGKPRGQEIMKRLAWFKVWVDEREQRTPRHYIKSEWQEGAKSGAYFLYRLVVGLWFIEALILSTIDVPYNFPYWLIYYTHWSFAIATAQAVLGLVLVALNQADKFNPAGGKHQNRACTVYEWLHAAAMNQAFCVTILYWSMVYNPKNGIPNVGNIQVHAVNSIVMLLDLLIVGFPIRLINFILPLTVSVGYLFFNFMYYLAGGKAYDGETYTTYIYKAVDWSKPAVTGWFFILCPFAVTLMHALIWWASYGRRLLAKRWERKKLAKRFIQNRTEASV